MNRDALKLLGQSFGLLILGLFIFVGWGPIVESLYEYGLWPRKTVEEVQSALQQRYPKDSIACSAGSDGWDVICNVVHRPRPGYSSRHKYGIVGSPFAAVGPTSQLHVDQPAPPREHFLKQQHARGEEQKRLEALVDLNNARVDQLNALGFDDTLAKRIVIAAMTRPFTSVDDLLGIQGIDRAMVERVRPFVRASKYTGPNPRPVSRSRG
jgi:hypothetical protein